MIPIKLQKKCFFLAYIKMNQEIIMFYKNQDKSYTMTDLYLNHNISLGTKILIIIMTLML